jgi:hypothetical protein
MGLTSIHMKQPILLHTNKWMWILLAYASHLKRTYVDITELRAKAINAKKDTATEPLIFLVNSSPPNLDTHMSLCDAATDDADIKRYASTYGWKM